MALQPGPWSDDGGRGPEAQRRAQVGARFFGFFFIDWKKKLAREARNKTFSARGNEEVRGRLIDRKVRRAHPTKASRVRRETKRSAHAVMKKYAVA
ncbi:hypothetical protein GCM10017655_51100 [Pseudomonas turukhanskensis]|uniref:Uncharacterized protein n=1 Tax=Pseudomonas turukhanskensis TaxID=1806536 RepID=A0A9W6KBZ6_9PSED|nr:hypothetical protein GCM10017655_51100 [Pseudomonas turukhanskensis]